MIKAMIFDMDGVLIDSMEAHFNAWHQMMEPYVNLSLDEFKSYSGRSSNDIFDEIKVKYGVRGDSSEFKKKKDQIYLGMKNKIKLYPNTIFVLDMLVEKGLKMGVGTSETTNIAEDLLEGLGIEKYFSKVVGWDKVSRSKPDPELFLKVASELGVNVGEAVVIEDAPSGVEAAKRAGIMCIAITTTTTKEKLSKADHVVDDIVKIIDLI